MAHQARCGFRVVPPAAGERKVARGLLMCERDRTTTPKLVPVANEIADQHEDTGCSVRGAACVELMALPLLTSTRPGRWAETRTVGPRR